jgi:hypothetical protein
MPARVQGDEGRRARGKPLQINKEDAAADLSLS